MLSNPFFLEMLFRHKRDDCLRETVRDRLLREARAGARRQRAAGRTEDRREIRTAVLHHKLMSGPKLMIAGILHWKHAATPAHSRPSEQADREQEERHGLTVEGHERIAEMEGDCLAPAGEPRSLSSKVPEASGLERAEVRQGHRFSQVRLALPGLRGLKWLRRRSRFVLVRVLDGGREVDGFQASTPEVLVAALRPIYAHLTSEAGSVELKGVEEEWLPLGVGRIRTETEMGSVDAAVSFLSERG